MSLLKVARMGHPVLKTVAMPLGPEDLAAAPVQALIEDMIETMREEGGVGLAAPQVHRPARIFVMDPEQEGDVRVLVNPTLAFPGTEKMTWWEGCLSMPGIRGRTERFARVDVTFLDREGNERNASLEGFPAAVVQHETDHLDGILFPQRMPDLSLLTFDEELARFGRPPAPGEEEDTSG